MKLVAPLEVGICVADLERMCAFYEAVLGFDFVTLNEVPPQKGREAGMCKAGYRIVRLQTNTGERIKLVQPNTPANRVPSGQDVLSSRGPAFLTFIVEDLAATLSALEEQRVSIRTVGRVEIRNGTYLAFAEDPEGNYLEFVEYDDVERYRADHYTDAAGVRNAE